MNKRQSQILEWINTEKKIEVSSLAERLDVSQVTIRKDLDLLEGNGLIKRSHGFATSGNPDDLENRLALHYPLKRQIAILAAVSVKDGETVMIESGSTCALLAKELTLKKDITIITNSAFIASYIKDAPQTKVILLGGEYQHKSQVTIGTLVKQAATNFRVDKLFVGVDGFSVGFGFTGSDLMRADTVRSMAESAAEVFVLTESKKFEQSGTVSLFPLKAVSRVYTDDRIREEMIKVLTDARIMVATV